MRLQMGLLIDDTFPSNAVLKLSPRQKKQRAVCWVLLNVDVLSTHNHEVQPLVWLTRISFRIISPSYKLNGFVAMFAY